MLALLDSLLTAGFDLEDQARRAVAWMDGPEYKPGLRFDIGIGTAQALTRVKSGVPAGSAGGRQEGDNGNGSLMWVLPVALVGVGLPPAELACEACLASTVTHGHARSRAACAVYSLLVQALLSGERDRDAALERAFVAARACVEPDVQRELDVVRAYPGRSGSGYVVDCFWSAWGKRFERPAPTRRAWSGRSPSGRTPTPPLPSPAGSQASTGASGAAPLSSG